MTLAAQQRVEHFTSSRRVRGDECPAGEGLEKRIEPRERALGARIERQVRRRERGEVVRRRRCGRGWFVREGDGGELLERGVQRGRLEEQLGRGEHGPLQVVTALLVARLDVAPGTPQRRGERPVAHDHGVRRQMIEQGRRRLEEQRQVELDARGRVTLADAAVDARARRIALEAHAEAPAEFLHRIGIERQLARRQQPHLLDRLERALGVWVEAADRLDLIVEQVDAQRFVRAHRKDIEQRAAHGELPGAAHLADAGVTGVDQAGTERLEIEPLTARELEGARLHILARGKSLHERVGRDDQAAVLQVR